MSEQRRRELRTNLAWALDRYWDATTAEVPNDAQRRERAFAVANASLKLHLFDQGFRAAARRARRVPKGSR